jgi:hypothetical protein
MNSENLLYQHIETGRGNKPAIFLGKADKASWTLGGAAVAFAIPFEPFLFSYAFLGPLHYLTEISPPRLPHQNTV